MLNKYEDLPDKKSKNPLRGFGFVGKQAMTLTGLSQSVTDMVDKIEAVSYTHLTLPTIYSV